MSIKMKYGESIFNANSHASQIWFIGVQHHNPNHEAAINN